MEMLPLNLDNIPISQRVHKQRTREWFQWNKGIGFFPSIKWELGTNPISYVNPIMIAAPKYIYVVSKYMLQEVCLF